MVHSNISSIPEHSNMCVCGERNYPVKTVGYTSNVDLPFGRSKQTVILRSSV